MKSFALFVLIIGVVFVVMGYTEMEMASKKSKKEIEYRFVPRSVYDEIGTIEVSDKYNDLFLLRDPISSRGSLYYSNLV